MNLKEELGNALGLETQYYGEYGRILEKCEQTAILHTIEVLEDCLRKYNDADAPFPNVIGDKIIELKSKLN